MMADSMLVPGRGLDGDAAGTPEFSHPWENSTRAFFAPALPGLREKLHAPRHHRRAPGLAELRDGNANGCGERSIADSSLRKTQTPAAGSANDPFWQPSPTAHTPFEATHAER